MVPGLSSAVCRLRSTARLPASSGDPAPIEQPLALGIQIAQPIGLKPIGQNAKQEMAGQVRGRSPPEHRVPTGSKLTDVEIAQARDLDVERLAVRQCRTDP